MRRRVAGDEAVLDRLHAEAEEDEASGADDQRQAADEGHEQQRRQTAGMAEQVEAALVVAIGEHAADVLAAEAEQVGGGDGGAEPDLADALGEVGRQDERVAAIADAGERRRDEQHDERPPGDRRHALAGIDDARWRLLHWQEGAADGQRAHGVADHAVGVLPAEAGAQRGGDQRRQGDGGVAEDAIEAEGAAARVGGARDQAHAERMIDARQGAHGGEADHQRARRGDFAGGERGDAETEQRRQQRQASADAIPSQPHRQRTEAEGEVAEEAPAQHLVERHVRLAGERHRQGGKHELEEAGGEVADPGEQQDVALVARRDQ